MRHLRFIPVGLAALLATVLFESGSAENLYWVPSPIDLPAPQAGALFGNSVAVGSMDGDGIADVVVGAYAEDVGGNANQGRAYAFSGADRSLLLTLDTPDPQAGAWFGNEVAIGRVDGDGTRDIVVSALGEDVGGNTDQGRAYVFSGADGRLLFTLDSPNPQPGAFFGASVAVGNVNNDGYDDIAVGAYLEDVAGKKGQGRADVFSGLDGSLLLTLTAPNPDAHGFGTAVAIGDVNGDFQGDVAVGSPDDEVAGNLNQGRVYVFSGAGGSLLYPLKAPTPRVGASFGNAVDIGILGSDGNGVVVGAPREDVDGTQNQRRAYVFSGSNGSLLYPLTALRPQAHAYFGNSVAVLDLPGYGMAAVGAYAEDVAGRQD